MKIHLMNPEYMVNNKQLKNIMINNLMSYQKYNFNIMKIQMKILF